MSDAAIFAIVFVSIFVLRIIAATLVFFWILPEGDRCPNCNAVTVRLQPRGAMRYMRWFRSSWCLVCGWSGLLRNGPATSATTEAERTLTHKR